MTMLPPQTTGVIQLLQANSVDPILYGSQGASLYLGAFKKFGDIDLLVDSRWLAKEWQHLMTIMNAAGFVLFDEPEHEFVDPSETRVAFASTEILVRDGIVKSLDDYIQEFMVGGIHVQTLKPELFKKAYEFSEKDGYRKDVRGKSDKLVIQLFDAYLSTKDEAKEAMA